VSVCVVYSIFTAKRFCLRYFWLLFENQNKRTEKDIYAEKDCLQHKSLASTALVINLCCVCGGGGDNQLRTQEDHQSASLQIL